MKLGRKVTGGKYHAKRKKRSHEKKSQETRATIGETKTKQIRVKGGNLKMKLLRTDKVNLIIDKKTHEVTIKNVLETPQNNFLARQNRLMKGAIIETTKGKAKITNRPSQEGFVNAILIK